MVKTHIKFAIILLFCVSAIRIYGQEGTWIRAQYVFGTWDLEGSPYLIEDDIILPTDSTLTIEAGVEVVFTSAHQFAIYGSLVANGTESDSIVFRTSEDYLFWYGLHFDTEYQQDVNASFVNYCVFKNVTQKPGPPNCAAIKIHNHSLDIISNSNFRNCHIGILISDPAQVSKIEHCVFDFINTNTTSVTDSYALGILTNNLIDSIYIQHNTFKNIETDGLLIRNNPNHLVYVQVSNNIFTNTAQSGNGKSAILIENNSSLGLLRMVENEINLYSGEAAVGSTVAILNNNPEAIYNIEFNMIVDCGNENLPVGGIRIDNSSLIYLNNNSFLNNTGKLAGAVSINCMEFVSASNTYTGNFSSGFASDLTAGALYATVTNAHSRGDVYTQNTSNSYAGSVYCKKVNDHGSLVFESDHFDSNSTKNLGGSLYLEINGETDSILVSNSQFINSYSETGGGAIAAEMNSGYIGYLGFEHNIFSNVYAFDYAGCIYLDSETEGFVLEKLVSLDNTVNVSDIGLIDKSQAYLRYEAESLPVDLRIEEDNISNIQYSKPFHESIYQFNQKAPSLSPSNLTINHNDFGNCNREICHISALTYVESFEFMDNYFHNVTAESVYSDAAGLFLSADSLNNAQILSNKFESVILLESTQRANGAVFHINTVKGINELSLLPFGPQKNIFSECSNLAGSGGCFYLNTAEGSVEKIIISDSRFDHCTAAGSGGCLYASAPNGVIRQVSIDQSVFDNCSSSMEGGHIFLYSGENLSSTAHTLSVSNNSVNTASGASSLENGPGGFLYFESQSGINQLDITSNQIMNLAANGDGGAIYIKAQETGQVNFLSNQFEEVSALKMEDTNGCGGVLFIRSTGNIGTVLVSKSDFNNCNGGGAGGHFYLFSGGTGSVFAHSLTVSDNKINTASGAGSLENGPGGFMYFESQNGMSNFEISANEFRHLSSTGNGGAFCFKVKETGAVDLLSNHFEDVTALTSGPVKGSGGAIYLETHSGQGIEGLNVISLDEGSWNTFTDCSAAGSGGALYVSSTTDIGPVVFRDGVFTNCTAGQNGGLFYLDAQGTEGIEEIIISPHYQQRMLFDGCSSLGSGGCLFAQAQNGNIENVTIGQSDFANCIGGDEGGHFYLSSGGIAINTTHSLTVSGNNVNSAQGASSFNNGPGGFLFFESQSGMSTVDINSNLFRNLSSKGDGGAFYIDVKETEPVNLISNQFQGISALFANGAGGSGGVIYLETFGGQGIKGMNFLTQEGENWNSFADCSAAGSGGVLFAFSSGDIGPVILRDGEFTDCMAEENGGLLFLDANGNNGIEKLLIDPNYQERMLFSRCTAGESGGCIFARSNNGTVGEVSVDFSDFDNCGSNGNGGHFYIFSGGSGSNFTQELSVSQISVNEATGASSMDNGSGGFLYYGSQSSLNALALISNQFRNISALGNGGAFFIKVKDTEPVDILSNHFEDVSALSDGGLRGSGGAVYLETEGGAGIKGMNIGSMHGETWNTFSNCSATGSGGAIYAFSSADIGPVRIIDGEFSDCTADENGGLIYLDAEGTNGIEEIKIAPHYQDRMTFNGCSAGESGGCAYASSINGTIGLVSVERNDFSNCSGEGAGGHIFLFSGGYGNYFIQGLTVSNNTVNASSGASSPDNGSGGFLYYESRSGLNTLDITSNTFMNLSSKGDGGTFFLKVKETEPMNLISNHFEDISAQLSGQTTGSGGAIYLNAEGGEGIKGINLSSPEGEIWNTFTNCSAAGSGGALYAFTSADIGPVIVQDGVFTDCRAGQNGGLFYLEAQGDGGIEKLEIAPLYQPRMLFTGCTAETSGGCVFASSSSGNIGSVKIDQSGFNNCSSGEQGGHLFLFSGGTENSFTQDLLLSNNTVNTSAGASSPENGSGGFLFYQSESGMNTLTVNANQFTNLSSGGDGGALCFILNPGLNEGRIEQNSFTGITSSGKGGMILINNEILHGKCDLAGNSFLNTDQVPHKPLTGGAVHVEKLDAFSSADDVFEGLASMAAGGAVYIEATSGVHLQNSLFKLNKTEGSEGKGGALFIHGGNNSDSLVVEKCEFRRNGSDVQGGGLYIENLSFVRIGSEHGGNKFLQNNTFMTGDHAIQGGAVYGNDIETFVVDSNQFVGNNSLNGAAIALNNCDSISFDWNVFIFNTANRGGVAYLQNTGNGKLLENHFVRNASLVSGGCFFADHGNGGTYQESDTLRFFNNLFSKNYSNQGGAIHSNARLLMVRNLFSRNEGRYYELIEPKGSSVYLEDYGLSSLFYNCAFDYNISESALPDGSVYFSDSDNTGPLPDHSFLNCTFLNYQSVLGVYSGIDINVINSLFQSSAKRDNIYFNDKVHPEFCDLVFETAIGTNFNEYVEFIDYNTFLIDSLQPVVDRGAEGSLYYDKYLAPEGSGFPGPRNDVGMTGGPYNFQDVSSFILYRPKDTLSIIINTDHTCNIYTFSTDPEDWDNYYWYLPNGEVIVTGQNFYEYECTLPSDQYRVRLLVEDESSGAFASGEVLFNVAQTEIDSISISGIPVIDEAIQLDNVPVSIDIQGIVKNMPVNPVFSWDIEPENPALLEAAIDPSTGNPSTLTIQKCNSTEPGFIKVNFSCKDENCDSVYTLTRMITVSAPNCSAPAMTFTPKDVTHEVLNEDSLLVTISPKVEFTNGTPLSSENCGGLFTLTLKEDNSNVAFTVVGFLTDELNQYIVFEPDTLIEGKEYNFGLNDTGQQTLSSIDCKREISAPFDTNFRVGYTGIQDLGNEIIILYPNPVKDIVHIEKNTRSEFNLQVLTPSGILILEVMFTDKNFDLNLTGFNPGIYVIRFIDQKDHSFYFAKLVKL